MDLLSSGLGIASVAKDLLEIRSSKKKKKEMLEIALRQYYSEVYYNRRVLETINIDNSMNKEKLSAIKVVAPLLKNEYGKTIVASLGFFGDSLKQIEVQSSTDKEDSPDEEKDIGLVPMIVFTVNRIDVLQNLANVSDEKYLKDIKVSVRLKNIKNYTIRICDAFRRSLDGIMDQILV